MFLFGYAAGAGGDSAAVGAGTGMSQEGADAVCGFGREDVLKPAGLLCDFFFIVHSESLHEQALCQAMTTDNVFRALASFLGKHDHLLAMAGWISTGTEGHVAAIQYRFVGVGRAGMSFQFNQTHFLHALQRQPHGKCAFHLYSS